MYNSESVQEDEVSSLLHEIVYLKHGTIHWFFQDRDIHPGQGYQLHCKMCHIVCSKYLHPFQLIVAFSMIRPLSLKTTVMGKEEHCVDKKKIKLLLAYVYRIRQAADASKLLPRELDCRASVIATIHTDYKPLFRIACIGKDEAWISNNKSITRVDINGLIHETVRARCQHLPNDISVTSQNELVYTDSASKRLKIIKRKKSKTLISTPWKWKPFGLCCTKTGDLLVNVRKNNKQKIIRYRGSKIKQEIYKDESKKHIFEKGSYVLMLTENNNGDVCVSDLNAETVVVVERKGRVRFRYDGVAAKKSRAFDPRCIVTDSLSQIIVTDVYNNCLHILDQDGNLIRCVDNCGLYKPYGLSIDDEERLWVGLPKKSEIKVIAYLP